MRGKGINYDTGFINLGHSSREIFDHAVVRREIRIIRDDLHCNTIRVTGGDPARLEFAAAYAAEIGLEVWFAPFTCDLTAEEMLALLADCAERAERIRLRGAEVVLVTGAELSLLNHGFLPGETIGERIQLLASPQRLRELLPTVPPLVNDFLGRAVATVRARFGGKVTYAAMPFENVDWAPFDFVSLDLYRTSAVAARFAESVRALVPGTPAGGCGKPVAITEFGCATYHGAADAGASAIFIVEYDPETAAPLRLNGDYTRDEAGQATYLRELLAIFDDAGVDTTFVFTFAGYGLFERDAPRENLDLASFGLVTLFEDRHGDTYPDMTWEPKAAFAAVAAFYGAASPA